MEQKNEKMKPFRAFLKKQAEELPKLPVPPLDQTLQQFLKSARPFVSEEEYKISEKLANELAVAGGIGEKLQKLLEEKAAKTDNWLSDWWLNMAYLSYRQPLPVYSSTGLVFTLQPKFNTIDDQLHFAAALVSGLLNFKCLLEQNKITPEKIGPFELDMSQYENLYSTCRIPEVGLDSMRFSEFSNYFIVARNCHFFAVPVYDKNGKILNQNQIVDQLKIVVEQSNTPNENPVGILTSENRDTWAKARQALFAASAQNRQSLEVLEQGLVMINLEDGLDNTDLTDTGRRNSAAMRVLHGCGGTKGFTANRWFDILVQFVITASGECGMIYEHSPGEAHPMATDHMELYCYKTLAQGDSEPPAGEFDPPRRLDFVTPPEVQQAISAAKIHADQLAKSVEVQCYCFKEFGKDFIRSLKVGTVDSFIQMAIQLTFFRLHEQPGAQYESATTKRFYRGRTETIRTCSVETINFVQTMLNPSAKSKDKVAALKMATQAHKDYIINAMSGQGVDRHLLALRLLAMENGLEVPQLFSDPAYTRSGHFRLSTSQVPTVTDTTVFFAPLVPDGYGCCYNPRANVIYFGITSFTECPETSAFNFRDALELSLNEMKTVISKAILQEKL